MKMYTIIIVYINVCFLKICKCKTFEIIKLTVSGFCKVYVLLFI